MDGEVPRRRKFFAIKTVLEMCCLWQKHDTLTRLIKLNIYPIILSSFLIYVLIYVSDPVARIVQRSTFQRPVFP